VYYRSKVFFSLCFRIVSISSCAQSHPSSIAMRYLQRKTIMCDPNWNKGHYYDGKFPKIGMKLARHVSNSLNRLDKPVYVPNVQNHMKTI